MLTSTKKLPEISEGLISFVMRNGIVVGFWATVLNGYSYPCFEAPLTVVTDDSFFRDYQDVVVNYVYIPSYNKSVGIVDGLTSSERTICDFLMYPKELGAGVYMPDIMEGYNEENSGDFSKVYDMMAELGIERCKLDYWLEHLDEYSDE